MKSSKINSIINLSKPLAHSAAQKLLLVQVFLASILCLLHFTNYVFNKGNIFFRSVMKKKSSTSVATSGQRS
jgi:hypothetical protein